ncbi:L,D-transpeptidase family protein [Prosthecobacter sp.]|uniref:L,D-transpeptidase family protein n=1 Tax=Prosthecobacter sp. TaxID=1965333 RepID=UPI003785178E
MTFRRLFLLLPLALSLVSCNTVKTTGNNAFHFSRRFVTQEIPRASRFVWKGVTGVFGGNDASFWYADDMAGRPSVVINLSEQMVYLFKGGQLAGGSPISSGAEGYDTRPGKYHVLDKDIDHKSSIYGDYEDFNGNVIMQNINNRIDRRPPGTRFEGAKMYYFMRIYGGVGMHQGYLPGYAASHGCIRLPAGMAEKFYREVRVGTPVEVVP